MGCYMFELLKRWQHKRGNQPVYNGAITIQNGRRHVAKRTKEGTDIERRCRTMQSAS
jgi:hypothetical protein